ncbi:MAG TPA: LysR family transcriptional regulator [Casimicrobiaceae bacterium]
MDRFLALSVFAKVVEQGSFARASQRLEMSTSAVSRHVADLEAHLDTRLLNRTTRRLSLTETGRAFHERCVQLLADLVEAEETVTAATVVPRGTLKLTCSISFGVRHLAPAIADFATRHPQLRFDVELSDRAVDIVDEGIDLAIRIGDIGSRSLIARKIGVTQLVCCAAPSYLARHSAPKTPADLAAHACLSYEYSRERNTWRFRDSRGNEHEVRIAGPAHSNNGQMLCALAVAGMGVHLEPDFIVAPDVRAGRLATLLPGYTPPSIDIYAAYPSRRHLSMKVRAFVDFLVTRFAGKTEWAMPFPSQRSQPKAGPSLRSG